MMLSAVGPAGQADNDRNRADLKTGRKHHDAIDAHSCARSAALLMMALAQTEDELKNDEKSPGDVLTYGMGYSQNRFSPLTHINRDNVKRLVPAWSYSMADNRGQEAQALV